MEQYDFPNKPNLNLNISPQLVIYALGAILLLWVASGIYIVDPSEQAVVLRFGKAVGISESGIHYHFPSPIERVEIEKVTQVKRVEIDLSGARIWDTSAVAALDTVVAKFVDRGISAELVGLNPHAESLHRRTTGQLTGH